MSHEVCCAHLRVSYKTKTVDGRTSGWWECDLCGHGFQPVRYTMTEADMKAAAKARDDIDCAGLS